ncbi:serine hydrolase [Aeromonas enteropelogenes]|uniref:serine hydrolase n=1 Tax=Aeromonas enteropelogenes TaxID=29489 RepID=UPI003BA17267
MSFQQRQSVLTSVRRTNSFFSKLIILILLILSATPQFANDSSNTPVYTYPLYQRSQELVDAINGEIGLGKLFTDEFISQIPKEKIKNLFSMTFDRLGKAKRINFLKTAKNRPFMIKIDFEKGAAQLELFLEPEQDYKIKWLRISRVEYDSISNIQSIEEISTYIKKLGGVNGFAFVKIAPNEKVIESVEPDKVLAIGSTFKLIVLGELVRAVNFNERDWDDNIIIKKTSNLPPGIFKSVKPGTSVSLRNLARSMIESSDNSAADILIYELGREKIKNVQKMIGFKNPDMNSPFLTTMELFKLKGLRDGKLGREYIALKDEKKRLNYLDVNVPNESHTTSTEYYQYEQPIMVDDIEWYASSMDLIRLSKWFYDNRNTEGGEYALDLLALNPGPVNEPKKFMYVGYKGGSEPGVINMTLIINDIDNNWYVISGSWNNSQKTVDNYYFESIVRKAVKLAF